MTIPIVTARVVDARPSGWVALFELNGFGPGYDDVPKAMGPYESRELAIQRRDLVLDHVITTVRAEGVHVIDSGVGLVRVVRVLGTASPPS